MGFKIKYKQLLRDTGAGGGGGATPPTSPPQEPATLPRCSPSPRRRRELPAPFQRRSPSPPPDAESKIPPRRNDHCDPYDQSGQHESPTKLFVGNMSRYAREQDLEATFGIYGRLRQVYLLRNYGFVVFYDPKDADAARNGLDGQEFCGSHITVQFAREHKMARYDTRYIHDDQNNQQDGNSKLFVSNISPRTQEHDIKDLFSKYGRVRKANLKENYGFVEFCDPQDADDARCKLNGQEFNGNRISVKFATGVPRGPVDSVQILCYNCGAEGHFSSDCKAGDWKDRCFRCGEKGHLKRNCRNSPKDIRRRRSHSRSQSPDHGMGQSWRRYRSRSRSYSQPPSPRRGNRNTGREELPSRSPCYSYNPRSRSSPPPPWEPAKRSGSFRDALPRRDQRRQPGSWPNYG